MRADCQVVTYSHGETIRNQVGGADDQYDAQRQTAARNTSHDRKCRDNPIGGAVNQFANVMTRYGEAARRFVVQSASAHSCCSRSNADDDR